MKTPLLLLMAAAVAGIAYHLGHRSGFRRGFDIAKFNSGNLLTQLKKANEFSTDLRVEEQKQRENDRSHDLN